MKKKKMRKALEELKQHHVKMRAQVERARREGTKLSLEETLALLRGEKI